MTLHIDPAAIIAGTIAPDDGKLARVADAAAYHATTTLANEAARQLRDAAIREADEAGHSRSSIARAARLSRETIYKVLGLVILAVLALTAFSSTIAPTSPRSFDPTIWVESGSAFDPCDWFVC